MSNTRQSRRQVNSYGSGTARGTGETSGKNIVWRAMGLATVESGDWGVLLVATQILFLFTLKTQRRKMARASHSPAVSLLAAS
jgi:hypothetical protein